MKASGAGHLHHAGLGALRPGSSGRSHRAVVGVLQVEERVGTRRDEGGGLMVDRSLGSLPFPLWEERLSRPSG